MFNRTKKLSKEEMSSPTSIIRAELMIYCLITKLKKAFQSHFAELIQLSIGLKKQFKRFFNEELNSKVFLMKLMKNLERV